jgi:sugar lactone lactonase YvrE
MNKLYIFLIGLFALFCLASCSDDYKASVTELRLVLVKPTNVYCGEIATILGRNFSPVPEENQVYINGVQATVLESSKDEMKVILPTVDPGKYAIQVKTPAGELTGLEINFLKKPEHDYMVQTIVGQKGVYAMADGVGTEATTKLPTGIAFAPDGSLWFTERGYNWIRRISTDYTVTSLVDVSVDSGSAIWQGAFDSQGNYYFADKGKGMLRVLKAGADKAETVASGLKSPMNVAIDHEDNIYVSARDNKAVYKFTANGDKTTFATFDVSPNYITFDKKGRMLVGTSNGYCLIEVSADGASQRVIAGDGEKGSAYYDGEAGNPLTARIGATFGIAAGSDGAVYISDNTYHCIRKLTPGADGDYATGTVETIAGSGKSGYSDGIGLKATFNQPYEIIISDDCTTMYVADAVNYLIRRITVK